MIRFKYPLLFMLLWIALPSKANVADSVEISISKAIAMAKEKNFKILNSRLNTAEAEKNINLYKADALPQINFSSSINRNLEIPVQVFPNFINDVLPPGTPKGPEYIQAAFGTDWNFSNFLGLEQMLFDGQWLVALKATKEVVTMTQRMEELTERQVDEVIMKSYYMCLLTEQSLNQTDLNIERIERNLADLKAYAAEGFVEKLEVDRLELNLSQLQISKRRYQNQNLAALNQLKVLLGMNPASAIKLTDKLQQLSLGAMENLPGLDAAIMSRPEYRVQTQNIILQELNVKRYKKGYLPKLYANASYQFNSFAQEGDISYLGTFFTGSAVGLSLRWNLFDGLRKKSQIDISKIAVQREKNSLSEMTLNIEREITDSKNNYLRAIDDLENARKNLDLAGRIRENTFAKYTEGVGSNFEYTTSENDYAQAEINLLIAIYNALSGEIEYKKALGLNLYNQK